ncbi:nuclear factor related to kappa-b-binding protein [Phtheirospermum japonicum]|uniref:Nuclear factor related to kappa-b-binding protein n=1 Tax=Phtheirospermum japonicum TaxID=374723 RepID=A0A830CY93_9LAMI|nr:nuclear factor related to kappa-b-binding protein [Phtheirospermum japonicum]
MAADQRKKRVNAASLVSCTSREQYRLNRKKMRVQKNDLNMRPSISLEWDTKKKSVVSKREQIGITQRHLISFLEPGPPGPSTLADVFSVPQEIFELENLSDVLSYEVWQSHLSDSERRFLSQFLPKAPEPDKNVRDLLAGDNFHFGNPCVKWQVGASLCYGELHPDNILHEEKSLKAGKKAYYSDLQKYHSGMIENLQTWKEKWASCKDPEVDIVQNMWSSRRHDERSVPPSETRFCANEENLVATPESCSWTNSEIAYSSDNQNLGTVRGESQRRNGFLKKISDNPSSGLKVVGAVSKKGEQLHKRNIQHTDGAKYMSYIKVSREQHERVKSSMKKHASNSIHPRSLNNVLGTTNALNVQPYERFVEEEKKKLHQHWLKLATKDAPEGLANWRKRQLQRQELTRSLVEEIEQKVECQTTLDEEIEDSQDKQIELSDDSSEEEEEEEEEEEKEELLPSITIEGVVKEQSDDDLLQEQEDTEEASQEMETNIEEVKSDYIFEESKMTEDEDMPDPIFIEDDDNQQQQIASLNNSPRSTMITPPSPVFYQAHQLQQKISSLNSNNPQDDNNSIEIESNGNDIARAKADEEDHPSIASEYPVDPLPSSSDVWPVGDVHGSYYQSTAPNAGYAIGNNPQFILDNKDAASVKDMLLNNRQHTTSDDMSFFNPYSNQDRNELLHSLFKSPSNLTYPTGNDLMLEAGNQFPGHFRRPNNDHLYLHHHNHHHHHNIHQESMYAGGRFASMPRQDDLGAVNIHDWTAVNSSVRMPVPSNHQSWYNNINNNSNGMTTTRDGWPSLDVGVGGTHSLGSIRNSDQTLFSVLSECNELPPRVSYDTMGSIQVGNYTSSSSNGGIGVGIHPGSSSSFLQQQSSMTSSNPLNYLNGHELAKMNNNNNNLGWMGMPQQNSESLGNKSSFLRSWNQRLNVGPCIDRNRMLHALVDNEYFVKEKAF